MTAAARWAIQSSIHQKLSESFKPIFLDVINESYMHNVPENAETHFKVVVVSDCFENLPLVKRHRMVNDALRTELANGVHALSIQAKTKTQWEDSGHKISQSPSCMGGSKR